jgi:hypothetical protein
MVEVGLRRFGAGGRLPRLIVFCCVGLAVGAVLIRYPQAIRDLTRAARENAALSYSDREIGGGNAVLPGQEVMYQARARIPEDATYEVVVGPPVEGWTELTETYASAYATHFLLPRRPAPGAPWILCFNCGLGADTARVVWEGEDDVSILRRLG